MTPLAWTIAAGALAAALVSLVLLFRGRRADPALSLLQQQLEALRGVMAQQLESMARQVADSQRSVGDRLDSTARVVGEVQRSLGELGQSSQRIFEVGKDIAGLQDLLRSPKLRGGLGEYFLGDLLAQILPAAHFSLQQTFASGVIVDAVIRLGDGLVPVDAKFPLENFRRVLESSEEDRRGARRKFLVDLKKHVDAIATKYILPDEGTYDFALMYIPAENVYYECVVKPEEGETSILDYALSRKVVPVSPSSFYAYLQAIVLGLRGLRVEENARRILDNLSRLSGDVRRFAEDFELVGRHLSNARTKHDDAARRLERVQDKLTHLPTEEAVSLPSKPGV